MRPRKPRTVPRSHGPTVRPPAQQLRRRRFRLQAGPGRPRGPVGGSVGPVATEGGVLPQQTSFDELNPRGSVMSFAWEVFSYTPLLEKWGEVDGCWGWRAQVRPASLSRESQIRRPSSTQRLGLGPWAHVVRCFPRVCLENAFTSTDKKH